MSLFSRKKPEEIIVKRAEVMRLEAGDIVVLHCDHLLSRMQMSDIRARLINVLPRDVTPVILDRGLELEVIRPDKPNVLGVAEPHAHD